MASIQSKPYRLGVALSGGGARGFAHVGALKALEEHGLKPDVIAGVSAGAVVAALYASGYPLTDMLNLFSDGKFSTFCKLSVKRGGIFKIDGFKNLLRNALGTCEKIEQLNIPTLICATDFDNGVPVAFDTGDIVERVAASCSIPILFHPVRIDGVRYVDGGVIKNMPSWTLRDKCECLIGVNCSPLNNEKLGDSLLDVALRTYRLMLKANQKEDMDICDLAVSTPEIAAYKTFNLKEIQQVYIRGYAGMKSALRNWPLLEKYSQ